MKGQIFDIFEAFVSTNWGEDTYDDIYEETLPKLETKDPFVGPGTYPDSDFMLLVSATVTKLQVGVSEAVYAFGKFSFPQLINRMPSCIEDFNHPKAFLKSVDSIIHVEVKKLAPDAEPPKFDYIDPAENQLVMVYQSKRRLYDFFEGMIGGVSDYFDVPITVERKLTTINGEEACEFLLTFGEVDGE